MRTARLVAIPLVICAACNASPLAQHAVLPWLAGFTSAASSDVESADVQDQLAAITGVDDDAGYGGLEIHAKAGSDGARTTVLASIHQGLVVVDTHGRVLARAPGVAPEGSADDLVALATGDGQLATDVIALALTTGGHRESTTRLVLYALGPAGRLDHLFDEPVEEHVGDATFTGSVTLIPRGLIYRAPRGGSSVWHYDDATHRYVRRAAVAPQARPIHVDAPERTPA